jgi:ParB family transcriptional regulator, chromosome partitioning protein
MLMRSAWDTALLLAKLPADQQEQALSACFKEVYNGSQKPARILLPVRNLQFWIDSNILLVLKDAPFNKRDARLISTAGSCADCPKRTGHNKLLFGDDLGKQGDRCTDPTCYQAKVQAHVAMTIAAKLELVQISTATAARKKAAPYSHATSTPPSETTSRSPKTTQNGLSTRYASSPPRPSSPKAATLAPFTRSARTPPALFIISSRKPAATIEKWKAEQEKQRKEQAIANATGLRVLAAIGGAVPVRLMKRDLLFILEKLVSLMEETRLEMLARQHGIRQKRDDGGVAKTLSAFIRRADEGTLSRLLVETSILLATSRGNATTILRDAATAYKVETDAIAAKVRQEFAAKEKTKKAQQAAAKSATKAA